VVRIVVVVVDAPCLVGPGPGPGPAAAVAVQFHDTEITDFTIHLPIQQQIGCCDVTMAQMQLYGAVLVLMQKQQSFCHIHSNL
jgi:hypothetical protein